VAGGPLPKAADQAEEPTVPVQQRDEVGAGDSVAPRNQPQSDLVLRTIRDLLDKKADTSDLEAATGMSRTEMEQFVKQYEKIQSGPAGPGREIEVKPGSGEAARAAPNLPGLDSRVSSTQAIKERGVTVQDDIRDNQEGVRFVPPAEFRNKLEGYKNALSRSRPSAPSDRDDPCGPRQCRRRAGSVISMTKAPVPQAHDRLGSEMDAARSSDARC